MTRTLKNKLHNIAQELYNQDYLPFEDIVTLCAVLKQQTGDDLPLNQAAVVAEQLFKLWENKTK